MRKMVERSGVTLNRREDGSFVMMDDEGFVMLNLPEYHRNAVKTFEFDDILEINDVMTSGKDISEILSAIAKVLEGKPRR